MLHSAPRARAAFTIARHSESIDVDRARSSDDQPGRITQQWRATDRIGIRHACTSL
jgi:hypothetical protein